jgi:multiple sugar transport system permease protein
MNNRIIKGRWYSLKIALRYLILILLGLIFLFPIVYMMMSSLKPNFQLLQDTTSLRAFLPVGDVSLNNYIGAYNHVPMFLFLTNSVLVTSLTVILGLIVNSLAAYSIAILRWRGRDFILLVIIATLIVPFETIVIPMLLLVSRLPWVGLDGIHFGWFNTYHVQIIPFVANAFSIFLFVQFFKSLPSELVEAARVDGANWFQIYAQVIVPLSGPVFATVTILTFLQMWNQYLWPTMVIQVEQYRPIMVGLQYFFQQTIGGHTPWGEIMAYLSTITIPVLVVFLSLQQAFVKSIATTGIKG